ncbi:MAG: Uma2 family endonuclease [Chromatiaceae bacterium]|nr:Uma2 family endonuclease [Chromatiaceae bacterium]MCF8003304.1 Uma2 family endonuclease [Chromatiaceae bacterium]
MAATAERIVDTPASAPMPAPGRRAVQPDDQVVLLNQADWSDYERLLEIRGESAIPRLTFIDGVLELMTPSWYHESDKKTIARLIETWALEMDVALRGAGSWTIKSTLAKRGAEPDECYLLEPIETEPSRPDIAIEVVRTSGGLNKLEVYRALEVPEVWFWQQGRLQFYGLEGEQYQRLQRSGKLPQLNPALIESCMGAPTQTEAIRQLRRSLEQGR